MNTFGSDKAKDEVILLARILLAILFVLFGWSKMLDYSGTAAHFGQMGTPFPSLAALIAIIMEVPVAIAIVVGLATRPLALLLALYTLGTALIGHQYWTMTGAARMGNEINFYKNVGIIGGFLLLYITGPGRYSIDALLGGRRD